jgi:MFS family permease
MTTTQDLWSSLKNTTFRSLRHRNYRRYFFGQIVSFIGSWMQSAALMWLLYDRTGDPRWPSWVLVAQVGPTVLLGTWGGGLADRYSRRRLILTTQSAFLVHATLLMLLIALDLIPPVLILGLMAVSGVIQSVDLPARLAFLPDLVPQEDLINAVGLNSLLFNSARALGPALAALLFLLADATLPVFPPRTSAVTVGAVACFAINALSFLAVLIALRGIHVPADPPRARGGNNGTWDGFRYLQERSALGMLVILTLILCVFGWPLITILPAYTRTQLGRSEQTFGLLVSAVGLGALAASLTVATFATAARRGTFLVCGPAIAAVGILGVALADRPEPAALACAASGFGLVLYLSTGQSTLQLAVPADRRGRVLALWAMTLSASAPIGHLLAGHAVTLVGVRPVLIAMATGAAVATTALALLVSRVDLRK